jgi:hypothetical protein
MLFQIEEPDGSPLEDAGPGVAIGIDLAGEAAEIAFAVGGNAEILPPLDDAGIATHGLRGADGRFGEAALAALLALRERGEKRLARPVTHAVVVLAPPRGEAVLASVAATAAQAGLDILRVIPVDEAAKLAGGAAGGGLARGAAILAEDLAARLPPPNQEG